MSVKEIVEKAKRDRGLSRIEELLEKEKLEKEAELERLKIERMVEEERKKLEELKKGGKPKESSAGLEDLGLSVAMVRELAKLPDDERRKVIETYAMLKSAERINSGTSSLLWPLLIGYAKSNPTSSRDSMVEFAKVMADQIKTGIELASKNQPQQTQSNWNPVEMIKVFADLVKDNVQKPLEELVERMQPQPSPFERILMDDRLFERAKALGMFGGGEVARTDPQIQLEIEKLRTERDMKLEEMRRETQKWMAQFQAQQVADERKWKAIQNILQGPVGQVISTMGGAAAQKLRGEPARPVLITCPNCGGKFYGSSDARIVVCPHCGMMLKAVQEGEGEQVKAPPTGEEASTQESQVSE